MKARFVRRQWENQLETIASFFFEPLGSYHYQAGQYAVLSLPHEPFDSRGYQRTMTLSSSPTEPLLKFTMRLLPVGGSSFKKALVALSAGDTITIFDSMGDLVLPLDTKTPLIFVAGGVGIASFSGMTQYIVDQGEAYSLQLHYAVSRSGDIALQSAFDTLSASKPDSFSKTLYTSAAVSPDEWTGTVTNQRLTAAAVLAAAPKGSRIYLSGTEPMVESLLQQLMDAGLSRQEIAFDFYDGY